MVGSIIYTWLGVSYIVGSIIHGWEYYTWLGVSYLRPTKKKAMFEVNRMGKI